MNDAILIQWLMGGFLALQSWMLGQIYFLSRKVAVGNRDFENIKALSKTIGEADSTFHRRIEERLDQLVSRSEFELNITQLRADIAMLQTRIGELNLAIRALELRIVEVEVTMKREINK